MSSKIPPALMKDVEAACAEFFSRLARNPRLVAPRVVFTPEDFSRAALNKGDFPSVHRATPKGFGTRVRIGDFDLVFEVIVQAEVRPTPCPCCGRLTHTKGAA